MSRHFLKALLPSLVSASALLAQTVASQDKTAQAKPQSTGMIAKATSAVVKTTETVTGVVRDEALHMYDFFDVTLPGALGKYNLVINFDPKAGDLVRREFVRFPVELRYGLSPTWEVYGGLTPVMPNPFKEGEDDRWGPGMGTLGLRHAVKMERFFYPDVSYGFETRAPLGEPPVDLIDHYVHLKPSVTGSRSLEKWMPSTTLFTTLSYDRAVTCPARENVPSEVKRRNVAEFAPGLLYKPGQFGAFAQYGLLYIEQNGGERFAQMGKIGVLWDMPVERSQKWHLPGKWQFEFGYKASNEEGQGLDHGVLARVRWRMKLKSTKK